MLDARHDFLKACHWSSSQVMGFPIGGDYLSITEGVLSRIEVPLWCTFKQLRRSSAYAFAFAVPFDHVWKSSIQVADLGFCFHQSATNQMCSSNQYPCFKATVRLVWCFELFISNLKYLKYDPLLWKDRGLMTFYSCASILHLWRLWIILIAEGLVSSSENTVSHCIQPNSTIILTVRHYNCHNQPSYEILILNHMLHT